jgi:hypothetical protein
MTRPALYVAITNHGFGHATRTAAVVAEIQRQLPDVLLILVTGAPRWLLESYITGDFIHRPRALDIGVVQQDSLIMDQATTLQKLRQIQAQAPQLIKAEADFIEQNRVSLILADIPPLATKIAQAAGIPCWMISNFGWDFIYRPWGGEFIKIADWIGDCFAHCDRLFRLPFHEPMSAFPIIEDVGLTGARPRHPIELIRAQFGLHHPPEKTVLLTFGGLGLQQIPYQNLRAFPDWQFISYDADAPEDLPNLVKVNGTDYRPVDLMPCCGRVVSKPGYGTFAEALQQNIPIATITRTGFAETPLLLEGIRNYSWHQILQSDEFFGDHWQFLHQPLQPPQCTEALDKGGNSAIAAQVVNYLLHS